MQGGPCDDVLEDAIHAEFIWLKPGFDASDAIFLLLSGPTGVNVGESATCQSPLLYVWHTRRLIYPLDTVTAHYGTGVVAPDYAINRVNINTKKTDVDSNDGASYYGITDSSGTTEITFVKKGTYDLKAHAPENINIHPIIRSQHLTVTVS